MSLSQSKAETALRGMTAIAQKVYACLPSASPSSISHIVSEVQRAGSRIDYRVAEGCLQMLKEGSLARRNADGTWIRTPVRAPAAPKPEKEPDAPPPPPRLAVVPAPAAPAPDSAQPPRDLLESVSALAAELRDLGARLSSLAAQAETIALEAEEGRAAERAAADKLRQLQSLLRDSI